MMRLRVLPMVFVLLGASACDRSGHTKRPGDRVTFGFESIAPGTVITRVEDGSVQGKATVGARRLRLEVTTREARRDEVLATRGGAPSDIRVTYEYVRAGTWDRRRGDETESHPVERRTYRIRRAGVTPKFSRADGRALTAKEKDKLRDDFGLDGSSSPVVESLRGRSIAVGETVDDTFPRVGDTFPTGSMTFVKTMRRRGRQIAVFDLDLEGRMDGARFDLDGEAHIDVETAASSVSPPPASSTTASVGPGPRPGLHQPPLRPTHTLTRRGRHGLVWPRWDGWPSWWFSRDAGPMRRCRPRRPEASHPEVRAAPRPTPARARAGRRRAGPDHRRADPAGR